jgi:hypothetical protein
MAAKQTGKWFTIGRRSYIPLAALIGQMLNSIAEAHRSSPR